MTSIVKKWYMVSIVSHKENKVIEFIKNRVVSENLQDNFDLENGFKVMLVPHISPKELERKRKGQDYVVKTRNLFKGYIFVKMNMTNDAWFVVRNTQYVSGLIGSSGHGTKPTPVSNLEMAKMEDKVARIIAAFEQDEIKSEFEINQVVEIVDGPAKGQVGKVLEKDDKRSVATIELILFERKTPTKVPYKNLKIKN